MPVVTFDVATLQRLAGTDLDGPALGERLPMMGGDLEHADGQHLTIEWFPDRPDLLPVEGTARALRAFLGTALGMPRYAVAPPATELLVDASVAAVRPYAALCFVRSVPFDDALVQAVVEAQEKLATAPGRRRRKIAIGVHDAAGVEGPFQYTCLSPDEKRFVPLKGTRPMTPAEVVAEHPKGQEFGHLVPTGRFPAFLDGQGAVLSLPPIINAARTTVTAATRDVLLDVTGTDQASVRQTVALLATCLAERGGTIEAVTVHDASGTWTCPDLRPREQVLERDDVHRLLGVPLSGGDIAAALGRMGHDAEDYDTKVLVQSPAWRFDLLHPIDWIEDVAIGHGYDAFPGRMPVRGTLGRSLPHQGTADRLRHSLLGLGWTEAMTLTLTDPGQEWGHWGASEGPHVAVRNPVLVERTMVRTRVVPGLLGVLAQNRHRPLPQRVWELGEVVVPDGGAYRNRLRLGVVEVAARTGFAEARRLTEAILRDMGWAARLAPADEPGFVAGRQGRILLDGRPVGHFGELHPDTIVAFGLGAATIAVELDVEAFL